MLVLVTYDVSVITLAGRRRLRNIARICQNYGVRVQNSVFECEVEPAQFVSLRASLIDAFNQKEDSLRFYFLGKKGKQKIEHLGVKAVKDPLRDTLIL
jgi:CRISPR-associated protein Cas2